MARVLVKRALQQALQGGEFREITPLGCAYGLFTQMIAQHELGIAIEHQIGRLRFILKRK